MKTPYESEGVAGKGVAGKDKGVAGKGKVVAGKGKGVVVSCLDNPDGAFEGAGHELCYI